MNRAERDAMIEEYGRGFDVFAAALAEFPREAWEYKTADGEWSIHEVIVHMSDSEAIGALRVRKVIAEPGSLLMPYDEARWAEALHYRMLNAEDALQSFRLTRQTTYQLLKTLTDESFTHWVTHPEVVHPEYGESYTLEKWLHIYVDHVPEHVEQLRRAGQAWKERKQ